MQLRAAVLCAWLVAGAAALAAAPGPSTARKLKRRVVALNRKARFQYEFLEKFEAGIALEGTEVKACREGGLSLGEGFAQAGSSDDHSIWLHGVHIAKHKSTSDYFNHEPKRPRRLLLSKRQGRSLSAALKNRGQSFTVVPTAAYFNEKNLLKVEIALARGKNVRDKRDDIKERDGKREAQRMVKNAGSAFR